MTQLIEIFFNTSLWVTALPQLLAGLKTTVVLGSVTMVLATTVGLLVAVARNARIRLIDRLLEAYVDVLRAWPSLVLLFLIYFALPLVGIRFAPYTAVIVALTLYNAAFISEIFRSGLEGVHSGQVEAARALGLARPQTLWFVVLPQALRIVLPPLASSAIALIKDTALASIIAVPDLMRQAQMVQSVYMNPSPLMAASLIYLAMLIPLVRLVGILELWAKRSG